MTKSDAYVESAVHRGPGRVCTILIGFFLCSTIVLSGCSEKNKNLSDPSARTLAIEPPDVLYGQAVSYLNAGQFEKASKKFSIIETQHAYTEWGRKSLVMGSFVNYQLGKYDDAVSMAQRYISLYPISGDSAYAYYIIGLASFRQIPNITRDQRDTKRAISAMQLLLERYPESEYAKDARDKIRLGRAQLAAKEMQVGRYYEKGRKYLAASKRFRTVIEEYSDTNQVAEALFRLTGVNLALGLIMEAQTAAAVLGRQYPESQWYQLAHGLLKKNGVLPHEHKSSWISSTLSSDKNGAH